MTLSLRLNCRLYRSQAVTRAIETIGEPAHGLVRRREGRYHVIELQGPADPQSSELLAQICDLALLMTVEMELS